MNDKKVYLFTGLSTLVLVIVGTLLVSRSQSKEVQGQAMGDAKLEIVGNAVHDWGQIDIEGGLVEQSFQIKNVGDSELTLTNIKTSCACTDAIVTIEGVESPVFGMHTKSAWKGTVKPGEVADIRVVFDPMFHGPQGTGPIMRLVSISTNAPENRTVEFKLNGNVYKK